MVNTKKKQFVQNLITAIQKASIVGVVNMQNLPAPQLQKMRAMLNSQDVEIVMARKRLLQLALKESKKENIDQLTNTIDPQQE